MRGKKGRSVQQIGLSFKEEWRSRLLTVCCPSGMRNSSMRIKDLVEIWGFILNELLQLGNLANLLVSKDLILLVTVDCQTGRVISSVFKTGESIDEGI